ncbi:MAG TPA: NUDIX hydrolase [Candidatus Acidoferrales bacterium]|nr:NUDIX hydrolase [Candidatus Acidoferrales bacterium]
MKSSREYPARPVVGVGGVVLIGGRVVLVRRANEPRKGEWSLPGGTLELGEALLDGTRRELGEETGLEVEVGPLIEVFERIHSDAAGRIRFHFIIFDYLCRTHSGAPSAGGDALEVALARVDELEKYALSDTAKRIIGKAIAMTGDGGGRAMAGEHAPASGKPQCRRSR